MLLVCSIAATIFFADLFLKTYLYKNFAYHSIPIIKNIFHITLVKNTGAAFGILRGKTTFLIYISIIFIITFLYMVYRDNKKGKSIAIAYGLILGGAVSNIYDRLFRGFVVDYIDLRVWPVFNLADTCITFGVFILFWKIYKNSKRNQKNYG